MNVSSACINTARSEGVSTNTFPTTQMQLPKRLLVLGTCTVEQLEQYQSASQGRSAWQEVGASQQGNVQHYRNKALFNCKVYLTVRTYLHRAVTDHSTQYRHRKKNIGIFFVRMIVSARMKQLSYKNTFFLLPKALL